MDGSCGKLPADEGIRLSLGGLVMGRPRILDYEKIKEMYEQDHTLNEIARATGSDHTSVGDAVVRMGLPKRLGHPQGKLDAKKDEIIADYVSGLSLEKTAEKHNCAKASVTELLARNGVELRHGAKRRDLANKLGFMPTAEWLQDQLTEHQTAAAIARAHSIPYGTLMELAGKLGVDVPVWRGGPGPAGSPVRQDIPVEEAIQLSEQGWPYRAIGDKFGVSKGVVMARLKEAGYSAPKDKMRRLSDNSVFATAPFDHKRVLTELGATACQICGYTEYLECAHIFPQNKGGPTVVDNVLALCGNCHPQLDRFIKYPHRTPPKGYEKVQEKVESALAKYGKN